MAEGNRFLAKRVIFDGASWPLIQAKWIIKDQSWLFHVCGISLNKAIASLSMLRANRTFYAVSFNEKSDF